MPADLRLVFGDESDASKALIRASSLSDLGGHGVRFDKRESLNETLEGFNAFTRENKYRGEGIITFFESVEKPERGIELLDKSADHFDKAWPCDYSPSLRPLQFQSDPSILGQGFDDQLAKWILQKNNQYLSRGSLVTLDLALNLAFGTGKKIGTPSAGRKFLEDAFPDRINSIRVFREWQLGRDKHPHNDFLDYCRSLKRSVCTPILMANSADGEVMWFTLDLFEDGLGHLIPDILSLGWTKIADGIGLQDETSTPQDEANGLLRSCDRIWKLSGLSDLGLSGRWRITSKPTINCSASHRVRPPIHTSSMTGRSAELPIAVCLLAASGRLNNTWTRISLRRRIHLNPLVAATGTVEGPIKNSDIRSMTVGSVPSVDKKVGGLLGYKYSEKHVKPLISTLIIKTSPTKSYDGIKFIPKKNVGDAATAMAFKPPFAERLAAFAHTGLRIATKFTKSTRDWTAKHLSRLDRRTTRRLAVDAGYIVFACFISLLLTLSLTPVILSNWGRLTKSFTQIEDLANPTAGSTRDNSQSPLNRGLDELFGKLLTNDYEAAKEILAHMKSNGIDYEGSYSKSGPSLHVYDLSDLKFPEEYPKQLFEYQQPLTESFNIGDARHPDRLADVIDYVLFTKFRRGQCKKDKLTSDKEIWIHQYQGFRIPSCNEVNGLSEWVRDCHRSGFVSHELLAAIDGFELRHSFFLMKSTFNDAFLARRTSEDFPHKSRWSGIFVNPNLYGDELTPVPVANLASHLRDGFPMQEKHLVNECAAVLQMSGGESTHPLRLHVNDVKVISYFQEEIKDFAGMLARRMRSSGNLSGLRYLAEITTELPAIHPLVREELSRTVIERASRSVMAERVDLAIVLLKSNLEWDIDGTLHSFLEQLSSSRLAGLIHEIRLEGNDNSRENNQEALEESLNHNQRIDQVRRTSLPVTVATAGRLMVGLNFNGTLRWKREFDGQIVQCEELPSQQLLAVITSESILYFLETLTGKPIGNHFLLPNLDGSRFIAMDSTEDGLFVVGSAITGPRQPSLSTTIRAEESPLDRTLTVFSLHHFAVNAPSASTENFRWLVSSTTFTAQGSLTGVVTNGDRVYIFSDREQYSAQTCNLEGINATKILDDGAIMRVFPSTSDGVGLIVQNSLGYALATIVDDGALSQLVYVAPIGDGTLILPTSRGESVILHGDGSSATVVRGLRETYSINVPRTGSETRKIDIVGKRIFVSNETSIVSAFDTETQSSEGCFFQPGLKATYVSDDGVLCTVCNEAVRTFSLARAIREPKHKIATPSIVRLDDPNPTVTSRIESAIQAGLISKKISDDLKEQARVEAERAKPKRTVTTYTISEAPSLRRSREELINTFGSRVNPRVSSISWENSKVEDYCVLDLPTGLRQRLTKEEIQAFFEGSLIEQPLRRTLIPGDTGIDCADSDSGLVAGRSIEAHEDKIRFTTFVSERDGEIVFPIFTRTIRFKVKIKAICISSTSIWVAHSDGVTRLTDVHRKYGFNYEEFPIKAAESVSFVSVNGDVAIKYDGGIVFKDGESTILLPTCGRNMYDDNDEVRSWVPLP